jgi:peptide/nickel transport system substrate-binding protein
MGHQQRALLLTLAVGLLAACSAPPATNRSESNPPAPARRPTTLNIAIRTEPSGMSDKLFQAADDVDQVWQAGLMYLNERDDPRPVLAARAPNQTDGTWTVNPDGTMRTTYALKPDLKWQDGRPLTAEDFAFAHAVFTDDEISVSTRLPESLMTQVAALDATSAEISWREPFIGAASLGSRELTPLPNHLLGDLYRQDKGAFQKSPYWTGPDYVGAGPFRMTTWDRGVGMTFEANPYFALGRPGIDTVRVSFNADANTVAAQLLAGAVDVFPAPSVELALNLKERWQEDKGGDIVLTSLKARRLFFQFRDVASHQKAVLDLRVRQALIHAVDRPAFAAAMQGSLAQVGDTAYPPDSALYPKIERVIAKYPYDVSRALALLGEAGWVRGADGMVRDSSGRTLEMEVRTPEDKDASIVADYWKQAGIASTPVFISAVNRRNDEYRASFPATQLQSGSGGYITNLLTANAPSPANGFRGSNNRGTYSNPEYDRLYRLQLTTLDPEARGNILADIERVITQDVAVGYLMYDAAPMVARSVVKGIKSVSKEIGNPFFNLWEWTVEAPA